LTLPQQGRLDRAVLQPMAINYLRRGGLPLAREERAGVACYDDTGFYTSLVGYLLSGSPECEVTFGTALPFYHETDRKVAARTVRDAVLRLFQRAHSPERGVGRRSGCGGSVAHRKDLDKGTRGMKLLFRW
jgi:hypothetical protein